MRSWLLGLAILSLFSICGLMPAAHAEDISAGDLHPGYLSDVSGERADKSEEFVIMPLAESTEKSKLFDQIFTQKLKHDFVNQYRTTFGYTEYEQIEMTTNPFIDVQSSDSSRLMPVNQYIDKQKQFGEYMLKALADYHVDNYFKHSRDLHKVYEAKQKLSNLEYKTKAGQKLKIRYNLANNTATISLEKSDERFHKSVDVQFSNSADPILRLGYDYTKKVEFESDSDVKNEIYTLIATRHIHRNFSANITLQTYQKDINYVPATTAASYSGTPKQNQILLGLSWND